MRYGQLLERSVFRTGMIGAPFGPVRREHRRCGEHLALKDGRAMAKSMLSATPRIESRIYRRDPMTEVKSPAPGQFCWAELSTIGADAAFKLYAELFDWSRDSMPMADGYEYFRAHRDGKTICGIRQLAKKAQLMVGQPSWVPFVETKDADMSVKQAQTLGGEISKSLRNSTQVLLAGVHKKIPCPEATHTPPSNKM